MKIDNVTEVNISIEEVMDEDKSPKDRCVENCMDRIHEIITINSKYARKFSTVVEEQLCRAWNEGYKYAYGTCWKNAAAQNITKEIVAEGAKNEGRKEVWDMVRRLYLADEVENAYDLADLEKVFGTVVFSKILQKDVHEVLAKDKERLKRIEEEKIISPGDEVEVDPAPLSDIYKGWVTDILGNTVSVLMNSQVGVTTRYVSLKCCKKTGNTNEHLAQLVKAMKEENVNE